jgi:hypothetical protein
MDDGMALGSTALGGSTALDGMSLDGIALDDRIGMAAAALGATKREAFFSGGDSGSVASRHLRTCASAREIRMDFWHTGHSVNRDDDDDEEEEEANAAEKKVARAAAVEDGVDLCLDVAFGTDEGRTNCCKNRADFAVDMARASPRVRSAIVTPLSLSTRTAVAPAASTCLQKDGTSSKNTASDSGRPVSRAISAKCRAPLLPG